MAKKAKTAASPDAWGANNHHPEAYLDLAAQYGCPPARLNELGRLFSRWASEDLDRFPDEGPPNPVEPFQETVERVRGLQLGELIADIRWLIVAFRTPLTEADDHVARLHEAMLAIQSKLDAAQRDLLTELPRICKLASRRPEVPPAEIASVLVPAIMALGEFASQASLLSIYHHKRRALASYVLPSHPRYLSLARQPWRAGKGPGQANEQDAIVRWISLILWMRSRRQVSTANREFAEVVWSLRDVIAKYVDAEFFAARQKLLAAPEEDVRPVFFRVMKGRMKSRFTEFERAFASPDAEFSEVASALAPWQRREAGEKAAAFSPFG